MWMFVSGEGRKSEGWMSARRHDLIVGPARLRANHPPQHEHEWEGMGAPFPPHLHSSLGEVQAMECWSDIDRPAVAEER
jgi:hypothetical protein